MSHFWKVFWYNENYAQIPTITWKAIEGTGDRTWGWESLFQITEDYNKHLALLSSIT